MAGLRGIFVQAASADPWRAELDLHFRQHTFKMKTKRYVRNGKVIGETRDVRDDGPSNGIKGRVRKRKTGPGSGTAWKPVL